MKQIAAKIEEVLDFGGMKKDILFLVLSGIALILSIFHVVSLPFDISWVAILLCGTPIVIGAILGLVTEFDIKADVLVSLALIASVLIGENFAAGEVAFIMQLGALLEDITVNRARAGIEKLVHLTPRTTRVIRSDKEKVIPAEEVLVGDIIRVLPGETVPVDGIINRGVTSINQAVMTGESMPVDKTIGDEVLSGTVNQFGVFEMEATKVGENSSIQRMIRLVQSADAGKAKIVGLADRWATWIVVIALTAASLTWLISGEIIRAVTILVVFCPCALVLATPTAIMAAIGNATKHGFLVKEGDALERLSRVSWIAFDKTGTLTKGVPEVIAVKSITGDYTKDEIYGMAAAAEQYSEHPLGKAITKCYKHEVTNRLMRTEDFFMTPGQGIFARVGDKEILAGNEKLFAGKNISLIGNHDALLEAKQYLEKGCTVIYIAVNGKYAGFLALSDTLREESAQMIEYLKNCNVQPVLLTGDHENAARAIASLLGIKEVVSACMPEDKLIQIEKFQKNHNEVCMIGDGVNDAPALRKANVGIAMGGVGSDIAVDAADIALVDDEVKELPHLLALSKRMMTTIKVNLTFSMLLNFAAIILAITGILNPIVGALVHNAGSVLVITNSALLLNLKGKWNITEKNRNVRDSAGQQHNYWSYNNVPK